MKKLMFVALAIITAFMLIVPVWAQIGLPNSNPVTENFDSIGTGATANLPANWKMSSAGTGSTSNWTTATNVTATTQQASSGSPTAGGRYNWATTAATDRAIGFMTSGSYASPNSIMAFYRNTSGSTISDLTINFQFERYRINTSNASVTFFTSTDGATWTASTAGDIATTDFPTGASSYTFGAPTTITRAVTLTGVNIPVTGDFYLRWVLNTTGTNSQGIGLDEVTVTPTLAEPATVQFASSGIEEDESQTAVVTVERFGDLSGTTTVDYSTEQIGNPLGAPATGGASCTGGVDFVHASGTLTFAPEENFKEISIQLCGDLISESTEYFEVNLSNVTGGVLGADSTTSVYINDTANQFVNSDPIFIGTSGDANSSEIAVTGAPNSIGAVRVTLFDFEHIDSDDVDVLLVGPQGQNIILMADAGGESGLAEGATITFEDTAGAVLPDNSQIFTGKYEPTSWEPGQTNFSAPAPAGPYNEPGSTVGGEITLASVFGGTNPNGTWTLYIRDDNGAFRARGADGAVFGGWGLQFLAPTAAGVSVGGQVRSGKTPIAGATVTISGGDLPEPRIAKTNSFGNYNFEGLTAGQIYVVTVSSKRYTFQQPSIVLNVGDNITGADFEAEE